MARLAFQEYNLKMILVIILIGGLLYLGYLFFTVALPVIVLAIKGIIALIRKGHTAKEKKRIIESIEAQTPKSEREKLKDEIRREILKEELRAEILAESKTKTSKKSKK